MDIPSKVPVTIPSPADIHIEPSRGWVALELHDLWKYREMIYFLTWRDVKVRYKQTVLGAAWAIIQPVFTMIVFSIFFGKLAQLDSEGIPYPIFSYAALLPWNYFSQSLSQSSNSIVGSAHLITKVYFPRLIIPLTSVVSGLVDFGISFLVLIVLMVYFQVQPTVGLFLLPLFLLLSAITALGVGLWLSALNVQYRDVRYIVPFVLQFWMFATPVVYSSKLLDEPWRTLYGLNPMVGVVEGFRWALLGTDPPKLMILISTIVSIFLVVSGIYYFRRMEKYFADLV
jgi:lipopolysaccharide transport system permease protein